MKHVLFSDVFLAFPTSRIVTVWRIPKGAFQPDCCIHNVKHSGESVVVWAPISWHSLSPLPVLDGRAKDYRANLEDHVQPEVQTLNLEEGILYVDDNALMDRSRLVTKWSDENESDVETLPWPAQSTDLNIIEPLWCVLEERVRNHFFFTRIMATVLQED